MDNFLNSINEPTVVIGGRATDDRGALGFINNLNLSEFKRFYSVENHEAGFIRAWHGHVNEVKALVVIRGAALICAVKMTETVNPSKDQPVTRVVLSASNTSALLVPAGFANGFKTLTSDTLLLVFSSASLDESSKDDYRFPYNYWNPWDVTPR